MIIIFSLFLDIAPRVEVMFNIGPMASQWPLFPWPQDGPIENIIINREPYLRDSLSYLIFSWC